MTKPPASQEKQSADPREYEVRIIVAGSRNWSNQKVFHEVLCAYMERFENQPVLFVSGKARYGADDLIYRWCRHYGFPCKEMPADWDNPEYKTKSGSSRAGMVRNEEMAEIATHALIFWDQRSKGTANMIDTAVRKGIHTKIVNVQPFNIEEQNMPLRKSDQPETITPIA